MNNVERLTTVVSRTRLFKVILCASEHICSIVRYCFRNNFKKIHYMY